MVLGIKGAKCINAIKKFYVFIFLTIHVMCDKQSVKTGNQVCLVLSSLFLLPGVWAREGGGYKRVGANTRVVRVPVFVISVYYGAKTKLYKRFDKQYVSSSLQKNLVNPVTL